MDTDLEIDNAFIQIRDKLQRDGVKLWLEPYYLASKPSVDDLTRLAEDYSKLLNLPQDACYDALLKLQVYSLDKLKQRKLFQESGIATLKIKILLPNATPQTVNKEVLLSSLVSELKNDIGVHFEVSVTRLKLISNGKILRDTDNLYSQGVQNGNHVLVVILSESITDLRVTESRIKEIETVKADTQLLASDTSSHYMELEDQAGNVIKIPENERKALLVAMALHEKGRSALKVEDYPRALTFFVDADTEFSQCKAEVLEMVDNYALLDLDMAWCYLCLQSVNQLPEAYKRLKRCELIFDKSYGPNLERVIALKGTPGNEAVLFLRLHLLQAIVLFHQNKRDEASRLFRKVECELQKLKVEETSLLSLVELGFSPAEARLGLRATHGDINLAANYINENREKRAESRKKALATKIFEKEQKKLGKCDNGKEYVNPNFLSMLVNMGFNKEVSRIALQKCNNLISDSIQHIQDNPGVSSSRSQEVLSLIEDLIPELQSAGFDYGRAKTALEKYNGDILQAANYLLTNDSSQDESTSSANSASIVSSATMASAIQSAKLKDNNFTEEDKKKKEEAFMRLSKDITMVDDDHLDFTLLQEEVFLRQYMSLLQD